jgi:cysteine sulfinate desulfinase/cysteine desulfurase-like protein
MNLPRRVIDGAIRVSFTGDNTIEQAEYFVEKLSEIAARLHVRQ